MCAIREAPHPIEAHPTTLGYRPVPPPFPHRKYHQPARVPRFEPPFPKRHSHTPVMVAFGILSLFLCFAIIYAVSGDNRGNSVGPAPSVGTP
jgi:hypothetical protein